MTHHDDEHPTGELRKGDRDVDEPEEHAPAAPPEGAAAPRDPEGSPRSERDVDVRPQPQPADRDR